MTTPQTIWRILNGKLDSLLRSLDAVGPKLDRAIGEAQAARAECRSLRERIAQLEAALGDRLEAGAEGRRASEEGIREEIASARREHVSLAEGIAGLHGSAGEVLARLDGIPDRFDTLHDRVDQLDTDAIGPLRPALDRVRRSLGRVEGRQVEGLSLERSEFQVYSQAGEDGILWRLAALAPPERRTFVEFGVEDYLEANSRFLLTEGGWSGLVLDGSEENVAGIRKSLAYWQYDFKAERAFVTRENIDDLLREHGMAGELGYLSIDIDGNDYWVWEAIDSVDPLMVSVEFNWRFGPDRAVATPYDPDFVRQSAHPSWLYFGASLAALEKLGARKGYALVAVGSSAVNAFFVKRELVSEALPARSAGDLWRAGRFSEFHDDSGRMVKLSEREQRELVLSLPLIEID